MCTPSRSGEGKEGEKRSNSCGADRVMLLRWLMAVSDSNDGKRREMVKVVIDDRWESDTGDGG